MTDAAPLGIGLDVEEYGAWRHLGPAALERAAERWLTADERLWCRAQPSLAEALVVVLSCKEAVFKAWAGCGSAPDVALTLRGSPDRGRARAGHPPVVVDVEWNRWDGRVVALAVAVAGSIFASEAL